MNRLEIERKMKIMKKKFPSPTGVKYYESNNMVTKKMVCMKQFPSPTGVKYYELKIYNVEIF